MRHDEMPCYSQGHFGPINAIGINPDGRSYASGGEDGYIRLHFFDQGKLLKCLFVKWFYFYLPGFLLPDYIEREDPVPEELIEDDVVE